MTSKGILPALLLPIMFAFLAPAGASAAEPDGAALAQQMKCYACHAPDEALIGPPWKAIAARHAGEDADMITTVLVRKIINGGGGTWGVVPMVPNEHVSEADARRLVRWILSQ
jgi:cytochrome c551/c552